MSLEHGVAAMFSQFQTQRFNSPLNQFHHPHFVLVAIFCPAYMMGVDVGGQASNGADRR